VKAPGIALDGMSGADLSHMIIQPGNLAVVVKIRPIHPLWGSLGCAREAEFYNYVNSHGKIKMRVPKVYYAYGDIKSGKMIAIMEDLSHIK
jgi:hypothetical protein